MILNGMIGHELTGDEFRCLDDVEIDLSVNIDSGRGQPDDIDEVGTDGNTVGRLRSSGGDWRRRKR